MIWANINTPTYFSPSLPSQGGPPAGPDDASEHGLPGPDGPESSNHNIDWLQSIKQFLFNVLYHILVASLILMALF